MRGEATHVPILEAYGAHQTTRNKVRTAPLWGLRSHSRFMHDGLSLTLREAILRHGGQAEATASAFQGFSATQKLRLFPFLNSL